MLSIRIEEEQEFYLDLGDGHRFYYVDPAIINLEHSLISLAKWEQVWHRPYLPSTTPGIESGIATPLQEISYIKCMIVGKVKPFVPEVLRTYHSKEITDYINNPSTATTIHRRGASPRITKTTTVTAELIYYWMVRFGIPFDECQKWHLNRLLTFIDVCNIKELEAQGKKTGMLSSTENA